VKTFCAIILSGATLALATSAFAQAPTPSQPPASAVEKTAKDERGGHHEGLRLARLDANKDGSVDLAEFTSMDRLKKADANGDGTLSQDEITAMVEKAMVERKVERATRRLDINGDGTVTLAEIEKQKAKRFAVMDRNDDGKIETTELRPWKHGMEHKAD
jgi:Ca2+-binding EF-hand superfamily protein